MIQRIAGIITACSLSIFCIAQDVEEGFELQELIRMAEVYHSTPHLSFDMQITYSDSASYPAPLEQLNGQYKLQEGRFWMVLDSMEMVQGPNYHLAVYHDAKTILVSPRQPTYFNLLQLPVLDSLFYENMVDSMSVTNLTDSTRKFEMHFKSTSPYSYYEIIYNFQTYMITSVHYHQPGDEETEGYVEITVEFSNYSTAPVNDQYLQESKFIFRDGNEFYVQPAYTGYSVTVNGIF